MNWAPVILLGIACGATFLFNVKLSYARIIAGAIFFMWAFSVGSIAFGWPELGAAFGSPFDVALGVVCAAFWVRRPCNWFVIVAALLFAQTAAHANYDSGPHIKSRRVMLEVELNVITWLQLAVINIGPRAHVIVDTFSHMLHSAGNFSRLDGSQTARRS